MYFRYFLYCIFSVIVSYLLLTLGGFLISLANVPILYSILVPCLFLFFWLFIGYLSSKNSDKIFFPILIPNFIIILDFIFRILGLNIESFSNSFMRSLIWLFSLPIDLVHTLLVALNLTKYIDLSSLYIVSFIFIFSFFIIGFVLGYKKQHRGRYVLDKNLLKR